MNPFLDLTSLKDQELQNKISELTRKYFMTNNSSVKMQIASILDQCNAELETRNAKHWDEVQKNDNAGLDKLINID